MDEESGPVANYDFIQLYLKHHDLYIHPSKNLKDEVVAMNKKGHCLCADNRKKCPCLESGDEILVKGKCKCTLFINWDYVEKWGHNKKINRRLE